MKLVVFNSAEFNRLKSQGWVLWEKAGLGFVIMTFSAAGAKKKK